MFSKLGPHCIQSTPAALAWSRVAPVVKSIDNLDPLRVAPDASIRVFRHFFASQDWGRSADDIAREILDSLGGYRHKNLYAEIYNENGADWDKLIDVVALLHATGVKVAVPSWATGSYEAQDWAEARRNHWAGADAIALHCYFTKAGWSIWHGTRWTQFWNAEVDPPVLITETGIDALGAEGGTPGWKLSGISGEEYVALLAAYDAELQRHPEVLGAMVFTAGPTSDWEAFSVDDLAPQLIADTPDTPYDTSHDTRGSMKSIYVACCYSLQDGNRYVPAGILGNNEYRAMRWLTEAKLVPMLQAVGVNARAFGDYPESQDDPKGSLSGLHLQMQQAKAWLDTCPADALPLVPSLHTDSGTTPHTFGIYGCASSERSFDTQNIAAALAEHAAAAFGHAEWHAFCQRGGTNYTAYVFWCDTVPHISVLIELCSHQAPADLDVLYNAPDAVVQALVAGILAYAGQPVPTPTPAPQPEHVTARQALDTIWGIGDQLMAYPVPQLHDAGQGIHDYILLAKVDLRAQGVADME